jgi:hypothetical protein
VTARPGVHVDVHQGRPPTGEAHGQAGLLGRLAERGLPGCLARLDVAARLQPDTEPLVPVEHGAACTHHDGRAGHVGGVCVLVERAVETRDDGEELSDAAGLAGVDGHPGTDVGEDPGTDTVER